MLGALGGAGGALTRRDRLALGALGRQQRAARQRQRLGAGRLGGLQLRQLGCCRRGLGLPQRALGGARLRCRMCAFELAARAQQRGLAARARAEGDGAIGVVAEALARDRDAARDAQERRRVRHEPDAVEQPRRRALGHAHVRGERHGAGRRLRLAVRGPPDVQRPALRLGRCEQLERRRQIVGAGQRRAALERRRDRQLVAGLGLDQRERQRRPAAHELGQRWRDAVGALDRRRERLAARPGRRCGRCGLGCAPLRLSRPPALVLDRAARAALGGERALVGRARRVRGRRGAGVCRLGRCELCTRPLGGTTERLDTLDDLCGACALRRQGGLGMRGGTRELGRRAARRERRLGALGRARGDAGELGLVDRRERRLRCAQALGGFRRGVGLQGERRGLGRKTIGQLALARRLGRHVAQALRQGLPARGQALGSGGQGDAVGRGPLLLAQDARQLGLGLRAARADLGQAGGCGVALGPRGAQLALALGPRAARVGQGGREQSQAGLGDLPAEHLGALGCGGLQLERAQARPQLALDVPRALEIGGDARELGLGALPASLELAQSRGLLDQPTALVRSRQQHLIDRALGDDAVQVAPEAGLGEQVAHVEAPHGLAIEQVVAVARAIEPAHDRELVAGDADAAVGVVEQQLDLADAARRVLLGAREEHVLLALCAQLAGWLGGHRPLQRIGDVGLARAVRPDDDGDAAVEAELERLAERLEAAQADCAQVHSRPSPSTRSSASCAAACSEAFLEGPSPVPMICSSSRAAEVKLRRCGGPVASISR